MNRRKIHNIVQYIKQFVFEYEVEDVVQRIESIFSDFQIYDVFTDEEMQELQKELLKLAEKFEISESLKLTFQIDPQLAIIPERKFSLRDEKAFRKAYLDSPASREFPFFLKMHINKLEHSSQ